MKYRSLFSHSQLGLDIHAGKCRIIHIKKTRRHYQIEHFALFDLPAQIVLEDKITAWDSLAEVLSNCLHEWQVQGRDVAIALPSRLVRTQAITLPSGLSDVAIEAEIRSYVQRDLSDSDELLSIDFVTREAPLPDSPNIFFAATRQTYLSSYIQCVQSTGLKVNVVDIDTYALVRAAFFALNLPLSSNQIMALLSVEEKRAIFIVFNSEEILFSQQWESLSLVDLMSQIKKGMQIYFSIRGSYQIYKWLIWAVNEEIKTELENDLKHTMVSPGVFSKMSLSKRIHNDDWILASPYLLMVAGLAIRALP